MRPRRLVIALLCLLAVITAIYFIAGRSAAPINARLVSSITHGTTKDIVVEFPRARPATIYTGESQLQTCVAGRWDSLQDFPADNHWLLAGPHPERAVFTIPSEANACRFSLTYRPYGLSRCRMYGYLNRYGICHAFPRLSQLVVNCVAQPSVLEHSECTLSLAPETHDKVVAAN